MSVQRLCTCDVELINLANGCEASGDKLAASICRDAIKELRRLREDEWTYDSLSRILNDELPLTMILGLVKILVRRMVTERMFAKRVDGVVTVVRVFAEQAIESIKEDKSNDS